MKNNEFLEMATSVTAGSLTLFLGTGFSKHMTNGEAPSWLELLYNAALEIDRKDIIVADMFIVENGEVKRCKFDLTVCAQILEEEFLKHGKNIKETIASIVKEKINLNTIDKKKAKQFKEFLEKYKEINIVTTNYDSIVSDYILPLSSKVVVEGGLIPKINDIKPIFHIHGSIKDPSSIILTEGDYFNFLHKESYMSRKFFTSIQESTLVIMGYSLGDFNLNRILNEAKVLKSKTTRKSDIYYLSRNKVNDLYQRYFHSTFGVSVIDETEINEFINLIRQNSKQAETLVKQAKRLPLVLEGPRKYTNKFLKLRQSFSNILLRADALGYSFEDETFQDLINSILERKKLFTNEDNAWEQYEHLADWLIQVGNLVEVKGSKIEDTFVELVKYSFSYMSEKLYYGYSWKSHSLWQSQWSALKPNNQLLIKNMVKEETFSSKNAVEKVIQ